MKFLENSGLFNMTCKAGVLMSHYTLIIQGVSKKR